MNPIGYYIDSTIEKELANIAILNDISVQLVKTVEFQEVEKGLLPILIDGNFLETSLELDIEQSMRLHAALVASGARHSGTRVMQDWPSEILAINQVVEWDSLQLSAKARLLQSKKSTARFVFENQIFLLGVGVATDGSLMSFITLDLSCMKGASCETVWQSLSKQIKSNGLAVRYQPIRN